MAKSKNSVICKSNTRREALLKKENTMQLEEMEILKHMKLLLVLWNAILSYTLVQVETRRKHMVKLLT